MTETYLERKTRRDAVEEEKNHIIFGLMGGIILMLAGGLNWLTATGAWEIACICIAALGLIFVLLAIVVPALLKYPYRAFRFFGNTMGKTIFSVILTVLYVLLILPVGLLQRRKRESQGYFTWEQPPPEARSMFADLARIGGPEKAGSASYFGIAYRLLAVFAANRKFILIPIVIILVIVGLVLFFVSSNVMTAFIYTLF